MLEEVEDLRNASYERVVVAGPAIRAVWLTATGQTHGLALALPEKWLWRARQVLAAR